MYRNAAQNYGQVTCIPHALPSPDNTSDSDAEILDALDEKRRQLDDDIARFKAAKDREFREFEKELRVKRKWSRPGAHHTSEPTQNKQIKSTSSATASALNLLASAQSASLNGRGGSRITRDSSLGDKARKMAPLSGPTLSLDKLNITGETTTPPVQSLGTPPVPTLLKRSRSRSPVTTNVRPATPPSYLEKEQPPLATPTPSKDRSDPFAGVFTPAYLPLLESRESKPAAHSPPPQALTEEETNRLQLDADTKEQAESQKLVSSQSLPPQQISPTLYATMRANSTPILPSASLPSALRNSSSGARRRKHVMFQLADLKVVDPSSSYEEGPSPELEERENAFEKRGLESVAEESRVSSGSPRSLGEKEKAKGRRRNGRFVSPMPSPLASPSPSPVPSPALRGSSPSSSPQSSPGLSSAEESGFSGGLNDAEDGGSGVGFFELDEELASPGFRDGKPVENFDLDLEQEVNEKGHTARTGLGIVPSVTVGSVPIDIIRPTGSFIGSYGH